MALLKRFIKYYKPHRKLFFTDLLCSLAISVASLLYPVIAKKIVYTYAPNKEIALILWAAAGLLGIYIFKCILNYVVAYYGHIVGVRIQSDMRAELFGHIEKLPFTYFDENKSGVIMSRIINDLFEVSELAHHGPEDLFLSVVMFIGSFIFLSTINIWLTLIIFAFVPFIIFFAAKMRKMMMSAFKKSREQIAEVNADIETAISGIRVTRAYTAESYEGEKFGVENRKFVGCRSLAYKAMAYFHSGMTFFSDILYLVVIVAGGIFVFNGIIGTDDFVMYIMYISLFLDPIKRFVSLFEQLEEGMTGFKRFVEIMDTKPTKMAPLSSSIRRVR